MITRDLGDIGIQGNIFSNQIEVAQPGNIICVFEVRVLSLTILGFGS